MNKRSLGRIAALAATFLLAGCLDRGGGELERDADAAIAAGERRIDGLAGARRKLADTGVRHAGRPWYGDADQSLRQADADGEHGLPLPSRLERPGAIAASLGTAVPIGEAADIIARASGMPVTVRNSISGAGGEQVAVPIRGGRAITHDGPLSTLLDRIAAEYDLFWRHDGRSIRLLALDSRSWTVPVPLGSTEVSSSSGGLSGGGDRSVSMTRASSQDPWAELTGLLEAAVEPPARIVAAPGSGRVMVTGRPSDLAAAERIIGDWNTLYSTRIVLEVGVYQLDADRAQEFQIGLLALSEDESPASLIADGGTTSIIGSAAGTGFSLNFTSLASHDAVLSYRTASTVALSGTAAPIILTSTRNYVSSVTQTETGTTVETGSVDDGISIHMVPRLIASDRIQLSLTLIQNSFKGLDSFGSVQLPNLDQRMISNEVLLTPGETLVLSGYEQSAVASGASSGFLTSGNDAEIGRVVLVVLVRPSLSEP